MNGNRKIIFLRNLVFLASMFLTTKMMASGTPQFGSSIPNGEELANPAEIGVLFLYQDTFNQDLFSSMSIEERIENLVIQANEIYKKSGIAIKLKIQRMRGVNLNVAPYVDLSRTNGSGPFLFAQNILNGVRDFQSPFAGIFGINGEMDKYGADYVVVLTRSTIVLNDGTLLGGLAPFIPTRLQLDHPSSFRNYNVTRLVAGGEVLVHELGHNMGLTHGDFIASCRGDSNDSARPFGRGWAQAVCGSFTGNQFGTIMVGESPLRDLTNTSNLDDEGFNDYFSNPRLFRCGSGRNESCGNTSSGDAARALNEHRNFFAFAEERDADQLLNVSSSLLNCLRSRHARVEVGDLRQLNCASLSVSDIGGIEQLTELIDVDLRNNSGLRDISPLSSLPFVPFTRLAGSNSISCESIRSVLDTASGQFVSPENRFEFPQTCISRGLSVATEAYLGINNNLNTIASSLGGLSPSLKRCLEIRHAGVAVRNLTSLSCSSIVTDAKGIELLSKLTNVNLRDNYRLANIRNLVFLRDLTYVTVRESGISCSDASFIESDFSSRSPRALLGGIPDKCSD